MMYVSVNTVTVQCIENMMLPKKIVPFPGILSVKC